MLNFTVGPVTCANDIASIGGEQIPYFRTAEFSALMKENEALIRSLSGAPENSRAVFITGSGTSMHGLGISLSQAYRVWRETEYSRATLITERLGCRMA